LEYTITTDTETEKDIDVMIPMHELNQFIEEEVKRVRKDLTLKGFRKGKVPSELIKSRYKDTLKAQAMTNLINDAYHKILSEKQWRPASQAEVRKVDEALDTFKIQLHFETIPEFAVDNYLNIELFEPEPLPDELLLERAMNELREENASVKDVSRPAVVDDFVTADMEISEDNATKTQQQNVRIRIGDRTWPDEINRALVGVKKSDIKDVQVDKLTYHITIKKLEERVLPPIDDQFARSKQFENADMLKKKLLENAKFVESRRVEEELKESLSTILLERNAFSLPQSIIKTEYERILERLNLTDSESQKERFWSTAEKRARFNLILDDIATKENIQPKDEEVKAFASAMGMKLTRDNEHNVLQYIKVMLTRDKTMDFLYKNAKISKKNRIISPKEVENDTSSIRHRTNR
jgi:trigger factor